MSCTDVLRRQRPVWYQPSLGLVESALAVQTLRTEMGATAEEIAVPLDCSPAAASLALQELRRRGLARFELRWSQGGTVLCVEWRHMDPWRAGGRGE